MSSAQPPEKSAPTALSALVALAIITTSALLADRAVAQGDAISQGEKTETDRPGCLGFHRLDGPLWVESRREARATRPTGPTNAAPWPWLFQDLHSVASGRCRDIID
jgi:hypothetical protein